MTITDIFKRTLNFYNQRPLMTLVTAIFVVFWFIVFTNESVIWRYGLDLTDSRDWADLAQLFIPIAIVQFATHKLIKK